jgi:hypothetical protein
LCGARKKLPSFTCINIQNHLIKSNYLYIEVAPDERRKLIMNHETFREALIEKIIDRLKRCNDISLLDLILKLLEKSM